MPTFPYYSDRIDYFIMVEPIYVHISLYSIQGGPPPNVIFAGYVSFQIMMSMLSDKEKYTFLTLKNK